MTVREVIEKLQTMDPDQLVRVYDSYWDSEGYGPHASDFDYLYPVVDSVDVLNGSVIITSDG